MNNLIGQANAATQYGVSAQNAVKSPTVGDHLQTIYDDVSELAARLCGIADRVSGSQPRGVEGAGARDQSAPTLHSMASGIKRVISELRSEVNRIDSAV